MKRLTAISFLLLLLFNLAGYQLWFYYAQQKFDTQLLARLEKESYNEEDLITLKVPLSLPYQTDWKEFERVDGEINLDGKIYKYVKRKVQDGQLILLCLPDKDKIRLQTAKQNFFKITAGVQTDAPAKKGSPPVPHSFKSTVSDFEEHFHSWSVRACGADYLKHTRVANQPALCHYFYPSIEQPPEV